MTANMVTLVIVCMLESILRHADRKAKRYYVYDGKNTSFSGDMLDYIATILMMMGNLFTGTIVDESGNTYSKKDYTLPTGFAQLISAGEVYFNEAGRLRSNPISKFTFNMQQYVNIISDIKWDQYGIYPPRENYHPVFMSPERMLAFYKNLMLSAEDMKLYEQNLNVKPGIVTEFDTVPSAIADQACSFGGSVPGEVAMLAGVQLPSGMENFLRKVSSPTEEELIIWMSRCMFSMKG